MTVRRVKYLSINIDIDQEDAFAQMTTDDLAAELASRGVSGHQDAVRTAIAQIRRGDDLDAVTTLEREFWPKWASIGESHTAYSAATRPTPANDNAPMEAALGAVA